MLADWVDGLHQVAGWVAFALACGIMWRWWQQFQLWRGGHMLCARFELSLGLPPGRGMSLERRRERLVQAISANATSGGSPKAVALHLLCSMPVLQSVGIQRAKAGTVNVWVWGHRLRRLRPEQMSEAVDVAAEVLPASLVFNVRDANTPERRGKVPDGTEWFHAPR